METHGTSPASAANFRMIDIGEKKDTQRRAVASGVFFAKAETILRIRERSLPKGDVLVLAEVAGIQGAKRTADLLPLCHPLALTSVRVWMEVGVDQIRVFCEAKTFGKTGVEMEALCGVNTALLCIYDLTKGIDPVLKMGNIQLDLKEGGKSDSKISLPLSPYFLEGVKAAVITLSDRCHRKEAEDLSGPVASHWLKSKGAILKSTSIIPDDFEVLQTELSRLIETDPVRVIITSGGTGLSKRDITPEAVLAFSQKFGGKEIPGMGELLRGDGAHYTKTSWLSRSIGFLVRDTLIICLPGSPNAVREALEALGDLIVHSLHISSGGGHS